MCLQKESLNKKERQAKEKHEVQGYGVHLTDAKKIISSHASSTIVQKPIMTEPLGLEWMIFTSLFTSVWTPVWKVKYWVQNFNMKMFMRSPFGEAGKILEKWELEGIKKT